MPSLFAHCLFSPESRMSLSLASHIFTDGSVNHMSGEAGLAFICDDYLYNRRIRNGASTLQAELFAIKTALIYAVHLSQSNLFSDSHSTLHT